MTVSEGVTIGAFLVLAGLTWWYAHQTKKLADQAEVSTEAARRSAESAERLLQLESLPIVWGRIESTSTSPKGALLSVAARNVGRGVALNVSFWLRLDGELKGPVAMGSAIDPIVGEAKGRLIVKSAEFLRGQDNDYAIICDYEDGASRRYRTLKMKRGDANIMEIRSDGSERRLFAD